MRWSSPEHLPLGTGLSTKAKLQDFPSLVAFTGKGIFSKSHPKSPKDFMVNGFLLRTLRYHIGTLAFGSLIIAVIRMIRLILEHIENKMKEYHQENPIAKVRLRFSFFII